MLFTHNHVMLIVAWIWKRKVPESLLVGEIVSCCYGADKCGSILSGTTKLIDEYAHILISAITTNATSALPTGTKSQTTSRRHTIWQSMSSIGEWLRKMVSKSSLKGMFFLRRRY